MSCPRPWLSGYGLGLTWRGLQAWGSCPPSAAPRAHLALPSLLLPAGREKAGQPVSPRVLNQWLTECQEKSYLPAAVFASEQVFVVCGARGAGSGHTGEFCVYAGRSGSCLHAEMGPADVNMKLLACKDQEDKATEAAVKWVRTWLRQGSEEGKHG